VPRRHAILDALTICSDGRRSFLTLLANDNKSRNCWSFCLWFAEHRWSARLVSIVANRVRATAMTDCGTMRATL